MPIRSCDGCIHAPAREFWTQFSQLPTCDHPEVMKLVGDHYRKGGVWQLYMIERDAPCGPKRKLYRDTL